MKKTEQNSEQVGRGVSELTRLLGTQPTIRREWAMPPFARNTKFADYRNDLNPDTDAEYNMHAVGFINMLIDDGVKADLVIFDPPYSPHQTKECYDGFGITMNYEDDARHGWYKTRAAIGKLLANGGIALSFGWDTIGIGKKRGFQIIEILLCCHGIGHNDTICTVESKTQGTLFT